MVEDDIVGKATIKDVSRKLITHETHVQITYEVYLEDGYSFNVAGISATYDTKNLTNVPALVGSVEGSANKFTVTFPAGVAKRLVITASASAVTQLD